MTLPLNDPGQEVAFRIRACVRPSGGWDAVVEADLAKAVPTAGVVRSWGQFGRSQMLVPGFFGVGTFLGSVAMVLAEFHGLDSRDGVATLELLCFTAEADLIAESLELFLALLLARAPVRLILLRTIDDHASSYLSSWRVCGQVPAMVLHDSSLRTVTYWSRSLLLGFK